MAWLKIDDRVRTHPKVAQAGPLAAWLWFCGICYCREHLTDGFIPASVVASLAMNLSQPAKHAARLVEVGLWHALAGGFAVHDFLDWNPSRTEALEQQTYEREKKRRQRTVPEGHDGDTSHTVPQGQSRDIPLVPQGHDGDASRDRAAGRGSALKSISCSSSEEGLGETTPVDAPGPPIFGRRRMHLANEGDPVPLTWDQFGEIRQLAAHRFGGDADAAYTPVLTWVRTIGERHRQQGAPSGSISNPWKFWRETAEDEFAVETPEPSPFEAFAAELAARQARKPQ